MLIFLHGQDSFRITERVNILRQGFQDKYDAAGYNIESFIAADITPDQLRSSLLSSGLFSAKRFMVLRDVFSLSEAGTEVFSNAVNQIGADTIIVCTTENVPKKKSELKTILLQADRVEEYAALSDQQLRGWVQQNIKAAGATITSDALAYLLHSISNDLWTLHNTINQLVAYSASITLENVKIFVQSPLDDNIFHLTDALSERNTTRALSLLHDQFAAGGNPFYILTMLARQIRVLIEVKETSGKGSSLHPYVVRKAQQHAQRFSLSQLEQMHQKLVNMDYSLKSSTNDPELLFDQFVIEATR